MNINVRCFATLSQADQCDFRNSASMELASGANVNELVDRLGIPREKVELVFVNGKKETLEAALSDGDRVGLFPAVGGM